MLKKTITNLSIIAIVIGSVLIANGLILAWTAPAVPPTGGNVAAPLNIGSEPQVKEGSLGIGVDTPSAKLHIMEDVDLWDYLNKPALTIENKSSDDSWGWVGPGILFKNNTLGYSDYQSVIFPAANGLYFNSTDDNWNSITSMLSLNGSSAGFGVPQSIYLSTAPSNYYFKIKKGSDDIFMVNKDGNVGIGTAEPGAKLEVDGNIKISSNSAVCDSAHAGEIRWTGSDFEGCNGSEWLSLTGAGADGSCPEGYEPFTNQISESCILKDDWSESGSASEGIYSATAETRMHNGKRQVRITGCQGYGSGSCTTDWSDDIASCKYYVYDVYQYGCMAVVADRYKVNLWMGNLYFDQPYVFGEKFFGPGVVDTIVKYYPPYNGAGVGVDVPKGEHKGKCMTSPVGRYGSATCTSADWPAKCIDGNCECESGYRMVERKDLLPSFRSHHYECVKN